MSIYAVVARMEKVAILKSNQKENQHLKEALHTDLNALFDLINENTLFQTITTESAL